MPLDDARENEIKRAVAQCRVMLENFELMLDRIDEEGKHRAPMGMMMNIPLWRRWFVSLIDEIERVIMARPTWQAKNVMQAIRDVIEFQVREGFATMRRATGRQDEGDK